MRRQHRSRVRLLCSTAVLFPLVVALNWPLRVSAAGEPTLGPGAGTDTLQAVWKPVEIRYSYVGYTTAYSCSAFQAKMKKILTTLGAHPRTRVLASGCDVYNRPYRNFFVTITTAVPVASQTSAPPPDENERKLIDKLGGQNSFSDQPFAANWKTVDLSRDRRVDLQPGDCELMQGLRDEVLPKLSVKIVAESIACMPGQVGIHTPKLVVSALAPVPGADAPPSSH